MRQQHLASGLYWNNYWLGTHPTDIYPFTPMSMSLKCGFSLSVRWLKSGVCVRIFRVSLREVRSGILRLFLHAKKKGFLTMGTDRRKPNSDSRNSTGYFSLSMVRRREKFVLSFHFRARVYISCITFRFPNFCLVRGNTRLGVILI